MAAKVKPIPDGYHSITPYLNIKDAGKTIEFLKKGLGAEELFRMPTPDGKVGHAELRLGDSMLMIGDAMMFPHQPSRLYFYVQDVDATFERAKAAGAKVIEPPTNMFYGDRVARIEDPSGNFWGLSTHVEDVPPEEMEKRAAAAMKKS